uniref:Uncharacterized protein n=1 Tax=Chelativorans sp. (strain BNC1) TaxID=266779 RepID=Q11EA4_CHESB
MKGLWAPASRQPLEPRPRDCDQFAADRLKRNSASNYAENSLRVRTPDRPSHRAIHLMPRLRNRHPIQCEDQVPPPKRLSNYSLPIQTINSASVTCSE